MSEEKKPELALEEYSALAKKKVDSLVMAFTEKAKDIFDEDSGLTPWQKAIVVCRAASYVSTTTFSRFATMSDNVIRHLATGEESRAIFHMKDEPAPDGTTTKVI